MKNKRFIAVLGLVVVAALSLTAWVVLRAPAASGSLFSREPASAAIRAPSFGETVLPRAAVQSLGPTSEQMYAAGRGELQPPKFVTRFDEPTSADFYAANGGVLD